MSYRFGPKKNAAEEARRVVCEQIDKAIAELTSGELDRHEAVHQARKRFKKIRGVLRLVRPELGKAYSEENAWYRDTARKLGALRDAEAIVGALEDLHEAYGEQMDSGMFERVRDELIARRARIAASENLEQTMGEVAEDLRQARARVAAWPLKKKGFGLVKGGLAKTYGRGRDAREVAYEEETPDAFHEWRKRVKYLWYHMRLMEKAWKPVQKAWAKELKRLSDLLGDDHDLAVLRSVLAEEEMALAENDAEGMAALIDGRRRELEAEAGPLGRRVYGEKPGALVKRMKTWWGAGAGK